MDIELRLLRSLIAIYETGSLSKAAERLHCTQAAMSLRLKMLEEELGEQLFRRQHHNLEPTSLGSSLYAKALGVLASYDEMMSATRSKNRIARVRIGVPDDYSIGIVNEALSRLRGEMSELEFDIVCDLSANLVASLHRQGLDLVLASLASPPAQEHTVVQAKLHWVSGSGFIRDRSQALLLSAYPEGCVFRRRMISALEAKNMAWRIVSQSRSHAGVLAAVRSGLAVTLMAEGTIPPDLKPVPSDAGLPEPGNSPIYLLRSFDKMHPSVARVEKALFDSLERGYVEPVLEIRRAGARA